VVEFGTAAAADRLERDLHQKGIKVNSSNGTSVAGTSGPGQAPSLYLLGAPTLGLALSITVLTALVPLLLERHTASSTVIGAVVAGEGLLALVLPLALGPWSDRTQTRFGARLPFVMAGTLLGGAGLVALAFVESLLGIALVVFVFYVGYFAYYPAYRALFPDLVPAERLGRSQGVQTIFREIGLALALTLGPLTFTASRALPFIASSVVFVALSVLFVWRIGPYVPRTPAPSERQSLVALLRTSSGVRRVLLANALWEFALASIKTFVVLYVVVGLGRTPAMASLLFGIVAVVAIIAAPVAGRLADRFGVARVMRPALLIYALGLTLPAFTTSLFVLVPAMPLIGFGGAVAMTLPFALLARHLPEQSHGTGAAVYEFSRGAGTLLGPLVTGAAIDLAQRVFALRQPYDVMWLTSALAVLISVPLLPRR
jgi:MFS family permease